MSVEREIQMIEGAEQFIQRRIAEAVAAERKVWKEGIKAAFRGWESVELSSGDREPSTSFLVKEVIRAIHAEAAARARGNVVS